MSEIKESLNRLAQAVRLVSPFDKLRPALIAIVDTLVEIVAVLPEPHAVPKEGEIDDSVHTADGRPREGDR